MVVVDTSVLISYFNGQQTPAAEWLQGVLGREELAIADLTACEYLQGFRLDRDYELAKQTLFDFTLLQTGGMPHAIASAANYRQLRKRGVTIRKTIDCLIATFCIENGHTLLHNDRDFDPFEEHLGLKVLRP